MKQQIFPLILQTGANLPGTVESYMCQMDAWLSLMSEHALKVNRLCHVFHAFCLIMIQP